MKFFVVGNAKIVSELISIIRSVAGEEHEFVFVSDNQRDAEVIAGEFDVPAFSGDLMDEKLYLEVGLRDADVVIAAHDNDMINVYVSMLAKEYKVPRVIAIVENKSVAKLLKSMGVADEVIEKSYVISTESLKRVFNAEFVYMGENVIAILRVGESHRIVSKSVKELAEEGIKVLAIIRQGSVIPLDNASIERGDIVVIFCSKEMLKKIVGG